MTKYGPSPGTGSLADWMSSCVVIRGEELVLFIFFCLFSYLCRFAARGRHLTKRAKWNCRAETGPGPVQCAHLKSEVQLESVHLRLWNASAPIW